MPSRTLHIPLPADAELDRIIPELEAARLRNVSPDTLRRQAKRGEGPRRIQLSPRRIGYRLREVIST